MLLTKSFEKLSSGKLSIKEQCVVDGIISPTHADQKNIHATYGQMRKKKEKSLATPLCLNSWSDAVRVSLYIKNNP